MKVLSWPEFLDTSPWKRTCTSITLGVFDGVHPGHQRLISRLNEDPSALPVIFTFRVNPAQLTRPKTFKGNILTLEQKLERMEKFGVKGVVIIDFSHDFSKLTGKKFFSIIGENTVLTRVVLGENHRLGHKGETGAEDAKVFLERDGVEVFIEESVLLGDSPVSSTRVRKAVIEGRLEIVPDLLGMEFTLDCRNIRQEYKNGFCRIDKERCFQVLPPEGIYRGCLEKNQELFATKIILDNEYILWDGEKDVPAERITLSNYEREET